MDKKKIDTCFDEFLREGKLTQDGAFKVASTLVPEGRLILLIMISVIALSLGASSMWVFGIMALFFGWLLLMQRIGAFPVTLVYTDRIEKHQSWGRRDECFYFSDLVCVRGLSRNRMCLDFKDHRSLSLNEALHPFFRTCFESEYINQTLCDNALRLFADVITLKDDVRCQSEGLKSALEFFSDPKFLFHDYPDKLTEMVDLFNEYRSQDSIPEEDDYKFVCSSIMAEYSSYEERMDLLLHLFACAYASDDMVDDEELVFLAQIASRLYIEKWDFLSLKYRFETEKQKKNRKEDTKSSKQRERYQSVRSNRLQEACSLLGLTENATLEEVKAAYRAQVKNCHPDTLPPTATEKEKEEAILRFRTITEAYDFLCAELSAEPVSVTK